MNFGFQKIIPFVAVGLFFLALFLWWAWKVKRRLISVFIKERLQPQLLLAYSPGRQKFKTVLLFLSLASLLVGLTRPQVGFEWTEARQQGIDIIVAIDTSKSMLANDVSPNRLTRARLAVLDLLKIAKNDRLGLIPFSGAAFLQCPLTLDEEAFRQSVEIIDTSLITSGGTDIGGAIDEALKAYAKNNDNHKVMILLTDGEDHEEGIDEYLEKARKIGLKIFTIGVGTPEGELIKMAQGNGSAEYLKDVSGNVVKSRLNESLLRKIADETGGFYLPLKGANPMQTLYATGLAQLPKTSSTVRLMQRPKERYHAFVIIGLLGLLAECLLSDAPKRKRTAVSAIKTKGVAALFLVCSIFQSTASPAKALKDFNAGNFEESQHEYQRLAAKKTNDYRFHYNAGSAAFKAQAIDQAEQHFKASLNSPDIKLQQQAHYNLGNTLFQKGQPEVDLEKKKQTWEQAVKNYEFALKLDDKDPDAKHNRDFVNQQLALLKHQQEEEKKQNQQDKNKDQKSKDQKDDKNDQKDQSNQKDQQNSDGKDDKNKDQNQDQKEPQKKPGEKDDKKSQESSGQDKKEEQPPDPGKQSEGQENSPDKDKNQKPGSSEPKGTNPEGPSETAGNPGDPSPMDQSEPNGNRMTRQEARRLLEMHGEDEKALKFEVKSEPKNRERMFKDW